MTNSKKYNSDISERTLLFATNIRAFLLKNWSTQIARDDIRQLIRSSGSVAANNIEAQEAVGQKDRIYRFKICRKEAKESILWINLLKVYIEDDKSLVTFEKEATELLKIFSTIINKLDSK